MKPVVILIAIAFAMISCGTKTKTRTEYVDRPVIKEVQTVVEVPIFVEKVVTVTETVTVRDHTQEAILQATIEQLKQVIDANETEAQQLRADLASANSDIEVILGIYAETLEENEEAKAQVESLREEVEALEAQLEAVQGSMTNIQDFIDATVFTNLGVGDIQACIDHKAQYPAWGRCYISINR